MMPKSSENGKLYLTTNDLLSSENESIMLASVEKIIFI